MKRHKKRGPDAKDATPDILSPRYIELMLHKLRNRNQLLKHSPLSVLLVALVVGGIGTYLLVGSHAASPFASKEVENGSLSGTGANKIANDSTASGSSYIQFGSAPTPPPPGNLGPIFFGTINNLNDGGSQQAVLDIGAKWIREDSGFTAIPYTSIISWAHSHGIKVDEIVDRNSSIAQGCGADAYELDNEPYAFNFSTLVGITDPNSWVPQMKSVAQQIRSMCPGKPILLPIEGYFTSYFANENYTYGGVTKPWVTWINSIAPDIWQYIDGVAAHPYDSNYNSPNLEALNTVRSQLKAIPAAANIPYWITEVGYGPDSNQGINLQTAINAAKARGDVQGVFFYNLQETGDNWGVLDPNGNQRPGWSVEHAVF